MNLKHIQISQQVALITGGLLFTCQSFSQTQQTTPDSDLSDYYVQVADDRGLGGVLGYGRGAAFADIDSDGDDDLFVADTDGRLFGEPFGMSQFYLNDGTGKFAPAELNLNPEDFHSTWVGSFADYDNDGDPDLLVGNGGFTSTSTLVLLENRISLGQGFVNVTAQAGFWGESDSVENQAWWGVSWADYDNDGWLDVIVSRLRGRPLLYHNDGEGKFSERGEQLGLEDNNFRNAKNPVWIDYDGDGDQDLYIAGMDWHGFYRNDIDRFENVTDSVFSEPMEGRSDLPVVFAVATADFDQDGKEDLYLGRWDSQDYIMFGNGAGGFERLGREAGLDTLNHTAMSETDTQPFSGQADRARRLAMEANQLNGADLPPPFENTMGLGIGDLFDDGWPDIVIGTGNPQFAAADVMFCNRGQRRFERCTDLFIEANDDHAMTRGHGAVFADVDRDGKTDLYINLGGHPPFDFTQKAESREANKLFIRQTDKPVNAAWLKLSGTNSNRDAIGARVKYGEGDNTRYHYVRSTFGFQSQNSATLLLPMGDSDSIPVSIDWPSGSTTELILSAGNSVNVVEPSVP